MKSRYDFFTVGADLQQDSSVFRYIGMAMTRGIVPYRDTFDHKGILMYFLNYWGALIAPIRGIWVVEVVTMAVSVVMGYLLARKVAGRGMSLLAVLVALAYLYDYMGGDNYVEEYAMPFQIIALYIFLDYFMVPQRYASRGKQGRNKRNILHIGGKWFNLGVFLCGMCFSAVFLLRANMVAIWPAFCVMVLIRCVREKEYGQLGKFILSFVLGAVIFALPFMIYLVRNNAFGDFIEQYFLFNSLYTSAAFGVTLAGKVKAMITFFNTAVSILCYVILVWRLRREKDQDTRLFLWGHLLAMLLSVLLISLSGQSFGHYGLSLLPLFLYPLAILGKELAQEKHIRSGLALGAVALMMIHIVVPYWCQFAENAANNISTYLHSDSKGWHDSKVIQYIRDHTQEDDRITVYGSYDTIYVYSFRLSASKYSYQNPVGNIDPRIMDAYFAELESKPPKIVVVGQKIDTRLQSFLDAHGYTLAVEAAQPVYALPGV